MTLQDFIKSKGFSLERLGEELGKRRPLPDGMTRPITRSGVHQMINGNPTLKNLREIASALNVSVSDLVADENDIKAFVEYRGTCYSASTVKGFLEIADKIRELYDESSEDDSHI